MRKRAGAEFVLQSAAERDPDQDGRRVGERAGPVDVGAQHHPIRRRHGDAMLDADAMLSRPHVLIRKKHPTGHLVTSAIKPCEGTNQRKQAEQQPFFHKISSRIWGDIWTRVKLTT